MSTFLIAMLHTQILPLCVSIVYLRLIQHLRMFGRLCSCLLGLSHPDTSHLKVAIEIVAVRKIYFYVMPF